MQASKNETVGPYGGRRRAFLNLVGNLGDADRPRVGASPGIVLVED